MRSRLLLLATTAVVTALVSVPASALPGGGAGTTASRGITVAPGSSWGGVTVELWQTRAGADAALSGGVRSGSWHACVRYYGRTSFFECGEPESLVVTLPTNGATGRVGFLLRDHVWGESARVELALTETGVLPLPRYTLDPRISDRGAGVSVVAGTTRTATARGKVTLAARDYTRRGVRTVVSTIAVNRPADVSELLLSGAGAGI